MTLLLGLWNLHATGSVQSSHRKFLLFLINKENDTYRNEGKCYLDDQLIIERGRVLIPLYRRRNDSIREDS